LVLLSGAGSDSIWLWAAAVLPTRASLHPRLCCVVRFLPPQWKHHAFAPALALWTGHSPWQVVSEARELEMACKILDVGYCTALKT